MPEIISTIIDILVRLPLWAVFSIPVFFVLFLFGSFVRKLPYNPMQKWCSFSLVCAFFLAPMPIGMFISFIPNAYSLFFGSAYYFKTGLWFPISFLITGTIFVAGAYIIVKTHHKALKSQASPAGTPQSGAP